MSKIMLEGNPIAGEITLPAVGSIAPNFTLVKNNLSEASLSDYTGKKVILNIFPSVDTATCATSVKTFNQKLSELSNTVVLCISADLPFAQSRFCGAEEINKVETLSSFRSSFGVDYGLVIGDSPLKGLLARVVIALDESGKVVYNQVVEEITHEPDYQAVIESF